METIKSWVRTWLFVSGFVLRLRKSLFSIFCQHIPRCICKHTHTPCNENTQKRLHVKFYDFTGSLESLRAQTFSWSPIQPAWISTFCTMIFRLCEPLTASTKTSKGFASLSIFNFMQRSMQLIGFATYTARHKWHSLVVNAHKRVRKVLFRSTKESGSSQRDFSHLTIAWFWKSQTISSTKEKRFPNKKAGKAHFSLLLSQFNSNLAFRDLGSTEIAFQQKHIFLTF